MTTFAPIGMDDSMSQQRPRRRPPRTRPRTAAPGASATPAAAPGAPTTTPEVAPAPAPDAEVPFSDDEPGGDADGFLVMGLAAGAIAVVAFLTILAAMAAS